MWYAKVTKVSKSQYNMGRRRPQTSARIDIHFSVEVISILLIYILNSFIAKDF